MKINFKLHVLALALFSGLMFTTCLKAQETRRVTLYVDTEGLQTNTPAPQVGDYCDFGQDPSIPNEDFLTDVMVNDIVEWVGVAKNGTDIVNIEKIIVQGGPNPFPEERSDLDGGGEQGKTVSVQVVRATGSENCKYLLRFTVIKNGEPLNRNFDIDPLLKVRPQ